MRTSELRYRNARPTHATYLLVSMVGALLLLLSSCAVQLAPDYDKAVVEGIAALNEAVTSFIAGAPADGYVKNSYPTHSKFYADAVGKAQALEVRASARPVPTPLIATWLGVGPKPEKVSGIGDQIPTVASLMEIERQLTEMRDLHEKAGFGRAYAVRRGQQLQILFKNALTYENALKR